MFSDLLIFATPKLQRANMVVALLQVVLKKSGHVDDARRLEGLDITNPEMARVALMILNAMNITSGEAATTKDIALAAVQDALRSPVVTMQARN